MEKVTMILARKQPHFKSVSPGCALDDALCRMNFENTDHLIVMDEEENYLGVITEHDIASKSLCGKLPPSQRKVMEIMNTCLPVVFTDDTVDECMQCMQHYHIKHLPVFEGHKFKGIVTMDDILYEVVWHRGEIFDGEESRVHVSY